MSDRNRELVSILRELAELTVLDEQNPQSFRVRAYENAIHGLEAHPGDLSALSRTELQAISGVGKGTAARIREYVETGQVEKLESLRARFPPEYVALSRVPGLGPKRVALLREILGIGSVDELRLAAERQELRTIRGFGARTEERLLDVLERLGLDGKSSRRPIAQAMPTARRVVAALAAVQGVTDARYCGSMRRLRETIGDLDIIVATDGAPSGVMDAFAALPDVDRVEARGESKCTGATARGLSIDLRVVRPEQLGAALLYFTGSKAHNIALRQRAMGRGWTLNEYALSDATTPETIIASESEEAIYEALGLQFIPPPMREGTDALARAAEGALPRWLTMAELRGDLHVHTSLSGDGRSPLEAVVESAAARGYEYLAITEHAEDLAINGVDRYRLDLQRTRIRALQPRYPRMAILHGIELNIGADGQLDYDADYRLRFDWCVAAVHSHFSMDRDRQTRRILRAMEDPAVHVIGHLTGRMIGRRPGIELDIESVLRCAVETGTALEINSALWRLDAATDVLHRARELGVVVVVSSDAHHIDELDRVQHGARHAQRAWVDPAMVANTWPQMTFLEWTLEKKKRRANP